MNQSDRAEQSVRRNSGFGFYANMTSCEYDFFRRLIKSEAGISLGKEKSGMVQARLSARLRVLSLKGWREYVDYLEANPRSDEIDFVVNRLTTNKTEFFREPEHFAYLRYEFLPRYLRSRRSSGDVLYCWSAASSRGHEAVSLAIVLEDMIRADELRLDYRILGTDINTDVLSYAEEGIYDAVESERDIRQASLHRYFLRGVGVHSEKYRLSDALSCKMKFRTHNLIESGNVIPISFDVVFLRNILIYFERKTIDEVIRKVVSHMSPGGILFVGHSEGFLVENEKLESVGNTAFIKNG